MNSNEQIMSRFYTCFQQLDWQGLNALYSDDIVFSDPAFGLLKGDEVRAMWEMLCKRAKDFSLTFSEVTADEEYGTCKWVAEYTFAKTGRRVKNRIKAHMRFADGKIIEHSDAFRLSKWCAMALGVPGILFGRTAFLQNKVRKQAKEGLVQFMAAGSDKL
jgi:ketosteroid isomerase-like protein